MTKSQPDKTEHQRSNKVHLVGSAVLAAQRLNPLHHQQVSQTRVVKGNCDDRHGPLPSLLPSWPQTFLRIPAIVIKDFGGS
jgi:hypothetical protein